MFDKFGEFDSADEMNRAAAAQRKEGDNEAIHPVKGAVPPGAGWPCHDVYGQSSAPGVGNEHAVLQRQKG